MIAFRIVEDEYADDPLTGVGAAEYGGRSNPVGTRVVYTSDSLPLAAWEVYVHFEDAPAPDVDWFLVEIDVADDTVSK